MAFSSVTYIQSYNSIRDCVQYFKLSAFQLENALLAVEVIVKASLQFASFSCVSRISWSKIWRRLSDNKILNYKNIAS